jgi:carbonic anhydrase
MSYPFLYKENHKAQACALFCMDFRFKNATLEYLKREQDLVDLDIVVLAGASKNIVNPKIPADQKVALQQLELSCNLHHIDKIVIIDHADCGAYGGAKAFGNNLAKEEEAHKKNLREAKKILSKKFPNQKIILIYANLKNQSEIVFEEIK